MGDMNSLEEVAQRVSTCTDCPLSNSRTHAVPGEGSAKAEIVFIGEGPGYQEDRDGRPFVGPAGRFLDELLGSIGIRREDVFIANMVKCRPPNNRDPFPAEIAACSKYLDTQLDLINPKLIVTLGRFSLAKYFPQDSISKVHGRPRRVGGSTVYPVMHPAAALHKQELKKVIEDDFKAIPHLLKEGSTDIVKDAVSAPPEQLSLF